MSRKVVEIYRWGIYIRDGLLDLQGGGIRDICRALYNSFHSFFLLNLLAFSVKFKCG